MKEVAVQAGTLCDTVDSGHTCDRETDFTLSEPSITDQNSHICIPGFDNIQPLLEIQTLNMKEIAVKHCVTNIMVQFDVTIPAKSDKSTSALNKTLSLTPIAIPESHTKVYKCKTKIFNAMLPAELCSILPKMISSIMKSNKISIESPASCLTKTDSWLSTIIELARHESGDSTISISPEIKHILEGRFLNTCYKKPRFIQSDFKIKHDQCLVKEMLPTNLSNDLLKYQENALIKELYNVQNKHCQVPFHQLNKHISVAENQTTCKSVQIYTGTKNTLTSAFKLNHFVGMIENIIRSHNLQINKNLNSYFDMLKQLYNGKTVEFKMSMTNNSGVQKNISVTINNLNIDSLYKVSPKINNGNKYQMNGNNIPSECIEYIDTTVARKSRNRKLNQVTLKKRKGFIKFYRKYKLKSNIPSGGKWSSTANTPLDKITTLDDFFQILGPKKIFSSVFDGNAAKKILSSVMEVIFKYKC